MINFLKFIRNINFPYNFYNIYKFSPSPNGSPKLINNKNNSPNNKTKKTTKSFNFFTLFLLFGSMISSSFIIKNFVNEKPKFNEINWIELKSNIREKKFIKKIEIINNNKAIIYPFNEQPTLDYILISDGKYFEEKVEKINQDIPIIYKYPSPFQNIIMSILPTILFILFLFFMMRNSGGGIYKDLFKNEAKILTEKPTTKISDVAGLHQTKKDVLEFSEIIMNPEKYVNIGARIPSGILMEGPPGTGKTMLARAIANHYDCLFLIINGADFIQPIVGTGNKKVQDLFHMARQLKPCIIFIDEIDAIGKSRSNSKSMSHDERENILNSLLVEMDGFEPNDEILVIGATNRADILDSALLRPGRFDRVVSFQLPTKDERKEILKIYYDKIKKDDDINEKELINELSSLTYGFNGADLSNIINEACISAVRNNNEFVKHNHFIDSIEYVLMGNKKDYKLSIEDKKIISYHEAGHALVSHLLENVASSSKVSIIPRSKGMLGYSRSYHKEDKKLYNDIELKEQIMVTMGGRAAEEIIFNKVTNGASDDINKINDLAKKMITEFGMDDEIGLKSFENDNKNTLWSHHSDTEKNNIDKRINLLIKNLYTDTINLLNENIDKLHEIQKVLMIKEEITGEEIELILKSEYNISPFNHSKTNTPTSTPINKELDKEINDDDK